MYRSTQGFIDSPNKCQFYLRWLWKINTNSTSPSLWANMFHISFVLKKKR